MSNLASAHASETTAFGARIHRQSVGQQAYSAILSSLKRSKLKPGQKLIARQVANDLGISVTPVRESLLRLVSENALIMDDRGTVMVPELSLERCKEIRGLRIMLEGEAAARAAERASEADIEQLEEIHRTYLATETDSAFEQALVENENFHFSLCRLAAAPVLFGLVENLWIQFGPVLSFLYSNGERPFHEDTHAHIKLIEALRNRNAEDARAAIARDIMIGGQAIIERLEHGA